MTIVYRNPAGFRAGLTFSFPLAFADRDAQALNADRDVLIGRVA